MGGGDTVTADTPAGSCRRLRAVVVNNLFRPIRRLLERDTPLEDVRAAPLRQIHQRLIATSGSST